MYQVIKRDGKVVEFNIAKISDAITKAFEALNKQYHPSVIDLISLHVTSDFESKITDDKITVEDIQDSVEKSFPNPDTRMSQRRISFTAGSGKKSVISIRRS